jgi:NADP-dependent 3-hydroxy acid dehydrogenase YdfG
MVSDIALVTGASKGVGRSIARKLAETGLTVFATARNVDQLESLKKEIEEVSGTCSVYSTDLSDDSQVAEMVNEILKDGMEIKVLVQNAGIALVGSVKNMPVSEWQETLDVNLTAPYLLTQKCIPILSKNAHIFFINSVAGTQAFGDWSAYCASKFGLKALADSLRQELAPDGIKVTTIYPASIDTTMQDKIPFDWDREKMLNPDDVAEALVNCYKQPAHVQIKDLHLENLAGTF